jgi:hypothetical protein
MPQSISLPLIQRAGEDRGVFRSQIQTQNEWLSLRHAPLRTNLRAHTPAHPHVCTQHAHALARGSQPLGLPFKQEEMAFCTTHRRHRHHATRPTPRQGRRQSTITNKITTAAATATADADATPATAAASTTATARQDRARAGALGRRGARTHQEE